MLHKQLTAAVGGRDFIYVRGVFGGDLVAHGGVAITHLQAEWARAKCPCQMPSNIEFSYANQEILMPHPGDELQMQSGEGVDVGWRHVPSASVSWAPNSELATQCVCTGKNGILDPC